MTGNMEMMFEDIMGTIFTCCPEELTFFCFDECYPIHPLMFGEYVMLEFVKHAYYESLEKHPLRHYLEYNADDDDHSERMRYARAMQYAQKYKDYNYQLFGEETGWNPEEMEKYKELLGKDMSEINGRLEGYELTEMDIFENENIQDLRIIKSVVEKRIISSKKVSNKQFIELFEEYDEWVEKLIERSNQSDADLLFASMAFFTIEWKYSLEFIYLVADYMDKNGINEVDYYTLWAMALPLKYDSILGINICGDNRMIRERQYLIPDFIIEGEADEFITLHRYKYIELIGLMTLFHNIESTEGGFYKDWFKENTNLEDWASFMEEYDIFSCWHKKVWSPAKIKKARKILEMLTPIRE